MNWLRLVSLLVVLALGGVLGGAIAEGPNRSWRDFGGGPSTSHFVDLDQINKSNVADLGVAWFYPYAAAGFNPIVVDDVIYVLGRNNALVALDATSGKEIWIHERLNGITSRGINFWQSPEGKDGQDRRLIFAINGYLQEIDARSGESIRTFGDNGIVDMRRGLARAEGTDRRVQSRSPGKIWKNLLIIGSASGEGFVTPPGDIRAYDIVTGALAWQFHTIPLPGEFGYDTWPKDAYKYAGGANNWGEMSVDDARGIVYVPTGSSTYDFYGADRHGANLFANCILALDARTGRRLWHYQTVHHDLWDLDNVSAPQLVTVSHDGRRVDAVAHAGKTGFLYVFDRVTGEPLWPIEERPVSQSDVPNELSWPTQPYPTKPPAFARQSFTADDEPLVDGAGELRDAERVASAPRHPHAAGARDTISCGQSGRVNWRTASDRTKAVFVVNVAARDSQLEDVHACRSNRDVRSAGVFKDCQACGIRLAVRRGFAPALTDVTNRFGEDAIRAAVTGGKGTMRPVASITPSELSAVISYLTTLTSEGRTASSGEPLPPGPIVASGGVPLPPPRVSTELPPVYAGIGGTGGNIPYPDGVTAPPARYVTEYGVMASATKPPYTTLTAYDLNDGTIKWQVPIGDDPQTIARGGPANTGGLGARNGMIVTKGGMVFVAGGDGKVRAYDEDNGRVLWTGTLPGNSSGIPVGYEAKGRQFIVFSSLPRGAGRGGRASALNPETPTDAPRGYIAFALPKSPTGR